MTDRFERKFFIVPRNLGLALAFLRGVCRPDRDYPVCHVNSLYFDTPDLEQYHKAGSGEYRKDKVRIRWYDEVPPATATVFLEVKSRQGFASSKQRVQVSVSSNLLARDQLARGIVSNLTLSQALAGFGYFPGKPLVPVVFIRYRRYRFNELATGVRVSLDSQIKGTPVALALGRNEKEVELAGGIVEVKGPDIELPATLRGMKILDVDWSRYSKYSNCVDALLAGPGDTERTWPSGRNAET
jgi:hypothetical protein